MTSVAIDTLWYTRCPVPSASGIAISHGTIVVEYAPDGIAVRPITEAVHSDREAHFSHAMPALFREGGNVPALAAKASGGRTVLLGLTFVPEFQAIAVLPDSPFRELAELAGRRLILPDHGEGRVDFFRAMSLRGYHNAFAQSGLSLSGCETIAVPRPKAVMGDKSLDSYAWEVEALQAGRGDAISVKGALGADLVLSGAVRPIWTVDTAGPREPQINNGTPRTITVSAELAEERPDLVVRYLKTLFRAAEWGRRHPRDVVSIVSGETGATPAGVEHAYGAQVAANLRPSLAPALLDHLEDQKRFLLSHGFIERDFALGSWIAPEFLDRALDE
ncbi:ABC transporter substrate-binding protein [Rhizobium puerariae]|uniref:ABC transporter substrate-binding protein n=1 Tax=Rhizobium puerariae TaxID=1585791 RepID=A0ABV6AEM4_9HYPH